MKKTEIARSTLEMNDDLFTFSVEATHAAPEVTCTKEKALTQGQPCVRTGVPLSAPIPLGQQSDTIKRLLFYKLAAQEESI